MTNCARRLVLGVFALLVLAPAFARAQHPIGIGGGEIDRYYRPGAYVPYDGAGRMHRINYDLGAPAFYFGYDACRLSYLDYLDRLDRQAHFGDTWRSRKYGPVYQIMRIENEYWDKWAPLCDGCWPW